MAKSGEAPKTTAEIQALRIATTTLRSARIIAKASKARLQALKGEVKIQKQHYKWARKQVRVAKDALTQWQTAAAAEAAEVAEIKPPASAARRANAAGGAEGKGPARPAKRQALAIKRHTLVPIAPAPGPSTVSAQVPVTFPE